MWVYVSSWQGNSIWVCVSGHWYTYRVDRFSSQCAKVKKKSPLRIKWTEHIGNPGHTWSPTNRVYISFHLLFFLYIKVCFLVVVVAVTVLCFLDGIKHFSAVVSLVCLANTPINMEIMGLSPLKIPCHHMHKAYLGLTKTEMSLFGFLKKLIQIQYANHMVYVLIYG